MKLLITFYSVKVLNHLVFIFQWSDYSVKLKTWMRITMVNWERKLSTLVYHL